LAFDELAVMMQLAPPGLTAASSFRALIEWLTRLVGADGLEFDAACSLEAPIHEHRLYRLALANRNAPAAMVAGMVAMLVLTYLRFGHADLWRQPEWEIARMGSNGRLPFDQFIQQLQRRLRSGPVTIGEITRWFYGDYVILQHQVIASGKLPDNTFRFRREGDRLQFFNLPNSLDFMDSRFDALATTVHGLGLCGDMSQPEHSLTADGQRLLA